MQARSPDKVADFTQTAESSAETQWCRCETEKVISGIAPFCQWRLSVMSRMIIRNFGGFGRPNRATFAGELTEPRLEFPTVDRREVFTTFVRVPATQIEVQMRVQPKRFAKFSDLSLSIFDMNPGRAKREHVSYVSNELAAHAVRKERRSIHCAQMISFYFLRPARIRWSV